MKYDESYYTRTRSEVLQFIPPDSKRILDVGCGGGNFGASVKNRIATEVWGCELNKEAAKQAIGKLDRVIASTFDADAEIPNDYFDVVVFNDSLEHFPDTAPVLEIAKSKLNSKGVVVASIPNVRYISNVKHLLFEKDWKYTDGGILDRTHLRFFTRKSMIRTFEENGFDVLSVSGINPHRWDTGIIPLLRLLIPSVIEDMKYYQFVVVARPRKF